MVSLAHTSGVFFFSYSLTTNFITTIYEVEGFIPVAPKAGFEEFLEKPIGFYPPGAAGAKWVRS